MKTIENSETEGVNFKLDNNEEILRNPVYQKCQFYPFRNQLIWHEKELQHKARHLEDKYDEIRD